MAINKVVYGNNTLIDLTEDSVLANNLLEGETAHDKSGNPVTGTAKQGHVVQNSSGTDITQRAKMQFPDSHVTDDETNGRTIVENIKEVSPADYDSTTDEGIIVTDDGNDALIGAVSDDYVEVTASGDTWRSLLAKLKSASGFDFDKITRDSLLLVNNTVYRVVGLTSTVVDFSFDASHLYSMIATMNLYKTGDSYRFDWTNTGGSAETSTSSVTDGTKLTLYYGNRNAVVDLQTTANRCWYDSENTVKQKIDELSSVRMFVETRNVVFENSETSNRITVPSALSGKTIYAMVFSSHAGGTGFVVREYNANSFRIQWTSSLNTTISCDLVWFYS